MPLPFLASLYIQNPIITFLPKSSVIFNESKIEQKKCQNYPASQNRGYVFQDTGATPSGGLRAPINTIPAANPVAQNDWPPIRGKTRRPDSRPNFPNFADFDPIAPAGIFPKRAAEITPANKSPEIRAIFPARADFPNFFVNFPQLKNQQSRGNPDFFPYFPNFPNI
jgi:hypothetical protein